MLRRTCVLSRWFAMITACLLVNTAIAQAETTLWQPAALTEEDIVDSFDYAHNYCPEECWYVSVSGGWQQRDRVHEVGDASTFIVFDPGFAANVALGYRLSESFRLEAEYSLMNNDCDRAGSGGLSSDTVGNVSLKAIMFNAYYDMCFDCTCWKPYFGAGVGIYQSEINGLYPDFFEDPALAGLGFAGTSVNATSDYPFAWQLRVGASHPLTERSEFFFGYRYFDGSELTFSAAPFAQFSPTFHPNNAQTHGLELGLRVDF